MEETSEKKNLLLEKSPVEILGEFVVKLLEKFL